MMTSKESFNSSSANSKASGLDFRASMTTKLSLLMFSEAYWRAKPSLLTASITRLALSLHIHHKRSLLSRDACIGVLHIRKGINVSQLLVSFSLDTPYNTT